MIYLILSLGPDGSYKYTNDLLRLNTIDQGRPAADLRFAAIGTPLSLEA